MKISEYKKLEKRIKGYNFNKSYGNINKIMIILSYFGNLASIFLAFFFMSKILSSAIENQIVIFLSSIIILGGLELLKRDIFDKLSIQSLKDKGISRAVAPILIISMLLIGGSFYSSLNGAKEFSSKSNAIELKTDENIQVYSDSITLIYDGKIVGFETQNSELFESNKLLDEEARELPAGWVNSKNQIRERIDINNIQIDKNKEDIAQLKEERDVKIGEYESKTSEKSESEKSENNKSSFIFIMLSTLIELVILGGIYFSEYYKFRSYKEMRNVIEKDPNYQKWLLYDGILSIIITDDTKMNEKLPSNKAIIDICKSNSLIVLPRDLTEFTHMLRYIGIIKISGSAKYFIKQKEASFDMLRRHFNIE